MNQTLDKNAPEHGLVYYISNEVWMKDFIENNYYQFVATEWKTLFKVLIDFYKEFGVVANRDSLFEYIKGKPDEHFITINYIMYHRYCTVMYDVLIKELKSEYDKRFRQHIAGLLIGGEDKGLILDKVLRWKRLSDNRAGSQEGFISEDVDEKIAEFQGLKAIRPLKTGYACFDTLLDGGFHKGQMYIFAGRLGTGKTRVMMNLVYNLAVLNQHKGIFFNFEMRKLDIDTMFFSMYTGLNQHDIKSGGVDDSTLEKKWKEIEQRKVQLNVVEKVGIDKTIEFIAGKVSEYKKRMPLDFIALDYIQLLEMTGFKPSEKYMMLGRIAEELKDLAVAENIAVLCTAQTNREQKNGEEFDSAYIGSSDKIGQVADFICGIERIKDANAIKLSIVKNRWGMCKKTIFTMNWQTNQMTEVATADKD